MTNIFIACFALTATATLAAKQEPLPEPARTRFFDDTEVITLAKYQKFTLPITTRTITHQLEMYPEDTNECQFSSESMLYKPLASVSFVIDQTQQISNMISLDKKEKLFLVDEEHNIFSYSLDEHFLLRKLSPKTKFAGIDGKVSTLALTADEEEDHIYFITPQKYFIFTVESLGVEVLLQETLDGNLKDVQKAFIYKGNLILFSARSGIFIYKIDKNTKKLTLVQKFTNPTDLYFSDMEFEPTTQMLYLLAMNKALIKVYHYEPSDFPNPDKTLTIFVEYDNIEFPSVTSNHIKGINQKNMHVNLQISKDREQQTLMVLFWHKYHYVIAELYYNINLQTWSFVRYFKFTMRVNQIHIIKDVVAVVGSESMGIFPYGIHPKLIDQEFNGQMALASIFRMNVLDDGRFVGLTKNSIIYGVIKLEQKAELNCKIEENSKLKTVKIRANLTACNSQDRISLQNYCAYEKTFTLEEMQLTVSAPMANILWTGMLFFILLIILGICVLFAMQKNKEEQIKKLETYFEQKKKAPVQSERRTFNQS